MPFPNAKQIRLYGETPLNYISNLEMAKLSIKNATVIKPLHDNDNVKVITSKKRSRESLLKDLE